jgi:hypothetical protein
VSEVIAARWKQSEQPDLWHVFHVIDSDTETCKIVQSKAAPKWNHDRAATQEQVRSDRVEDKGHRK